MKLLLILLLAASSKFAIGQPFIDEIKTFRKQDSIMAPPKNAILFVGSSSFTKWKDVQDYFPGYTIINRGFGGSSLTDVIYYEQDVIFKYHPKEIVMYCGENDFAASDTVSVQTVFQRFKHLYADIRKMYPRTKFVYISMKPTPSRWRLKEKMIAANDLIKDYLKKQKQTVFISVWKSMLGADGKPRPEIFVEDNLHMNKKGYAIWQNLIQPYLIK